MLTRAQVEFLSVEPKVCDQEATLYDLVLKPSAVGSRSRLLAHQQHVLATFGERVGIECWHHSWLDFGKSGARGPLCDMRIPSGSCCCALLNGAQGSACT